LQHLEEEKDRPEGPSLQQQQQHQQEQQLRQLQQLHGGRSDGASHVVMNLPILGRRQEQDLELEREEDPEHEQLQEQQPLQQKLLEHGQDQQPPSPAEESHGAQPEPLQDGKSLDPCAEGVGGGAASIPTEHMSATEDDLGEIQEQQRTLRHMQPIVGKPVHHAEQQHSHPEELILSLGDLEAKLDECVLQVAAKEQIITSQMDAFVRLSQDMAKTRSLLQQRERHLLEVSGGIRGPHYDKDNAEVPSEVQLTCKLTW